MPLKLGWFSTGRGEGSRGLLRLVQERVLSGDLPATIDFVFCNRALGEAEGSDAYQALVRSYDIPLVTLSAQRFRARQGARSFDQVRAAYDREVVALLKGYTPEVCVLAGYMLILSPEACNAWTCINLHPAAPGGPAGAWQEVIWELIARRASESGAYVHLAIDEVDQGPIITYLTFPIQGPDFDPLWQEVEGKSVQELKSTFWEELPLFQRIRQEGLKREPYLLLETIRALAEGKVRVVDRRVVDGQGRPITGYCLDAEIEVALSRP